MWGRNKESLSLDLAPPASFQKRKKAERTHGPPGRPRAPPFRGVAAAGFAPSRHAALARTPRASRAGPGAARPAAPQHPRLLPGLACAGTLEGGWGAGGGYEVGVGTRSLG